MDGSVCNSSQTTHRREVETDEPPVADYTDHPGNDDLAASAAAATGASSAFAGTDEQMVRPRFRTRLVVISFSGRAPMPATTTRLLTS